MTWIRNHLNIVVPGAIVLAAVFAYLAFGVFGIQTKFIDDEVAESGPVFASGADASGLPSDSAGAGVIGEATGEDTSPVEVPVSPASSAAPVVPAAPASSVVPAAPAAPAVPPADTASAPGEIVTVIEGSFVDRSHPGSGIAKVLNDGTEQRFLRFEDFETDNGPDLFVYLTRADATADAGAFGVDGDFVDLGRLKGNIGDQNYEIPADVDLGEFDTVVVWCDRFSVAFTAADLV